MVCASNLRQKYILYTHMRFFKLPFFVLPAILLFCNACKEKKTSHKQEYVYIDSLQTKINIINKAINGLNASELKKRINIVNTWYVNLKDTAYNVAKKQQLDFNGFKVIYQKYIDNFFVYEAKNSVLNEKVAELKKQVTNDAIARPEFKKQYALLKQEVDTLYKNTIAITKPVNDLAFSWQRYAKEKGVY